MAKTKTKRGKSPEQRKAEIDGLKAQLEQWQAAVTPEQVAEAIALFDGYSERNAQLIAAQMPAATDVDAFRAWLDRGRQVTKGQHGIRIMAPAGSYATTTGGGEVTPTGEITEGVTTEWTRFRAVSVFDISQTEPIVPKVAPLELSPDALAFEQEACMVVSS